MPAPRKGRYELEKEKQQFLVNWTYKGVSSMDSSLSLSGPISRTIKTQYGNIAAYKKGAGSRTVLLLHGAGCDSTMLSWREVFNTFSDDYSVYAFDFLTHISSV